VHGLDIGGDDLMQEPAYEAVRNAQIERLNSESKFKVLVREIYKNKINYIFCLPMYFFLTVFLIIPTFQGLYLSFFEFTTGTPKIFIGVQNFSSLFQDPVFWIALRNTLVIVVIVVPSSLFIALLVSVAVYRRNQVLKSFVRAAYYLPLVVSSVALSISWKYIYDPAIGLGNYIIGLFGFDNVVWLGDSRFVLFSLIIIVFTFSIGTPIVLYLASLGSIPETYYEAARIDGAGVVRQFFNVTLPMLLPTTLFLVVTGTIGAFQVFVFVKLLTSGGPNNASQTLAYFLYEKAFIYGQFGIACAVGTLLCLFCIGIAIIEYKFLSSDVEY
jgi:multiple sugar transport system permease protein